MKPVSAVNSILHWLAAKRSRGNLPAPRVRTRDSSTLSLALFVSPFSVFSHQVAALTHRYGLILEASQGRRCGGGVLLVASGAGGVSSSPLAGNGAVFGGFGEIAILSRGQIREEAAPGSVVAASLGVFFLITWKKAAMAGVGRVKI